MAKENRKSRVGQVTSNRMHETVVVSVAWQKKHPIYRKGIKQITKFYVHDANNACKLGDRVRIEETRPISKIKRWRVLEILERHEVAEVKPVDLDEGLLTEEKYVQSDSDEDVPTVESDAKADPEDNT